MATGPLAMAMTPLSMPKGQQRIDRLVTGEYDQGWSLEIPIVFSSLALVNSLRDNIVGNTMGSFNAGQLYISLERIEAFLVAEDEAQFQSTWVLSTAWTQLPSHGRGIHSIEEAHSTSTT